MRAALPLLLGLAACEGLTTSLTPEEFLTRFEEKWCDRQEACNPSAPCREGDEPLVPGDCPFDADAGQACLDTPFPCNTDDPDMAFAEIPEVCFDAFPCE